MKKYERLIMNIEVFEDGDIVTYSTPIDEFDSNEDAGFNPFSS